MSFKYQADFPEGEGQGGSGNPYESEHPYESKQSLREGLSFSVPEVMPAEPEPETPEEPETHEVAPSSTGRIRAVSTLGASHTPHVRSHSPEANEDSSRERMREPLRTLEPKEARWPGSTPPTVDPYGPRPKRDPHHMKSGLIFTAVLALVVVGVFAFFQLNPVPVDVTVNGVELQVSPRISAADLEAKAVEAGVEQPHAGNHLAIDGSILQEGGGDPYTVTVNGKAAGSGPLDLADGAQIEITNGGDTTEDFNEEVVDVAPSYERTGTGAIHAYVKGAPGKANRKTGTESGTFVDEVIEEPVAGQLKCYNADTGGDKVIVLTFDDGPWANPDTTRQILDVLEENDAKATFFTVGNCIQNAPDQVKRAFDAGHEILTHSRDHAKGDGNGVDLTRMKPEDQIAEITEGYDAIEAVTGQTPPTVIRAPGGNFDGDILATVEPYVTYEIGWNIDTMDWSRPGAESVEEQLMRAGAGDIVLMHDGGGDRSQTVEALAEALPKLKEQGYRFVTIDELLSYNDPAVM